MDLPIEQFKTFVKDKNLFSNTDKILLAVSGGRDSVLMAHLFKSAGFNFGIAHCNFNLRGAEAIRDEQFVRILAEEMKVPFHIIHFDTKSFAKQKKISTQMAARELRYQWFDEISESKSYQFIALAQHQNDTIETVLINLIRGTGISGLHGILPKRGNLIRPLLFLNRDEVDKIIKQNHIPFVEDSSNLKDNYTRNNIRLNVIPYLKEINPQLEQTFNENIKRFAEIEQLLNLVVAQKKDEIFNYDKQLISINKDDILKLQPQKLLFFELLRPFGFSSSVVDEVLSSLNKQSGTYFLSKTYQISIDREKLVLSPIEKNFNLILHLQGEGEYLIDKQKAISLKSVEPMVFNFEKNKAFVDADKLIFPLIVRYKIDGDKFVPLGMTTKKKLSDFFIDNKISIQEKKQIPLLINGNGDIIWVCGLRQDERYKITNNTKKVMVFEIYNLG